MRDDQCTGALLAPLCAFGGLLGLLAGMQAWLALAMLAGGLGASAFIVGAWVLEAAAGGGRRVRR